MKIKIPNKIKIGADTYKLKYQPHLKVDEGFDGLAQHRLRIVTMDPVLHKQQKDRTYLHEVLHIINEKYRCRLDEDTIERISSGFYDFLIDTLKVEFDWLAHNKLGNNRR